MGIVMLLHDPVKHRQSLRSDGSKTAFRFSPRARQAITLEMGFTLCQFSRFFAESSWATIFRLRRATRRRYDFAPTVLPAREVGQSLRSAGQKRKSPRDGYSHHWSPVAYRSHRPSPADAASRDIFCRQRRRVVAHDKNFSIHGAMAVVLRSNAARSISLCAPELRISTRPGFGVSGFRQQRSCNQPIKFASRQR